MARDKSIKIRLNDAEYAFLKGIAEEFDSTISHYVRYLIRKEMDSEDIEEDIEEDDDYDYDPEEKYRGKTKDCSTCIFDSCEGGYPCSVCTDDYPLWEGK